MRNSDSGYFHLYVALKKQYIYCLFKECVLFFKTISITACTLFLSFLSLCIFFFKHCGLLEVSFYLNLSLLTIWNRFLILVLNWTRTKAKTLTVALPSSTFQHGRGTFISSAGSQAHRAPTLGSNGSLPPPRACSMLPINFFLSVWIKAKSAMLCCLETPLCTMTGICHAGLKSQCCRISAPCPA